MKGRRLTFAVAAALSVLLLWRLDVDRRRLRASHLVAAVERRSVAVLRQSKMPVAIFEAHLAALREAAALAPGDISIPIAEGTQYLLLGRPDPAIEAYRRALALEPRPEAYLNLGKAMLLKGDARAAKRMFRKAVRLDPGLASSAPKL